MVERTEGVANENHVARECERVGRWSEVEGKVSVSRNDFLFHLGTLRQTYAPIGGMTAQLTP